MKAKIGDKIEWFIDNVLFKSEIVFIDKKEKKYHVHANYGQDKILFKNAKVIRVLKKTINEIYLSKGSFPYDFVFNDNNRPRSPDENIVWIKIVRFFSKNDRIVTMDHL